MSASATLQHEEIFERHLLGLIGGGFLGGMVASILELVVGREVEALGALGFAAVVGLVINQLDPREDTALVRLILALIGGALMGGVAASALPFAPFMGAALGGAFIGGALTFDREQTRARKLGAWALFGGALAAGVFTSATLFETGFLAPLEDTFLREALTGTTWGVFLAVAAGLSDLKFEQDAIVGRLDEAIDRHKVLVADYLESARELYRQVTRECERAEHDDTRLRAREIGANTVDALLGLAARFEDLERTIDDAGSARLQRRLDRLERRKERTDDPELAAEIEQAKQEALQQLQMRQRVELACTRLESRLQRSVTTLEKLHLTLVQHATSSSSDPGLAKSLASLEQLAEEVQLKSMSVDELCEMRQMRPAAEVTLSGTSPAGGQAADGADGALDVSRPHTDADDSPDSAGKPSPNGSEDTSELHHEQVVSEHDASC